MQSNPAMEPPQVAQHEASNTSKLPNFLFWNQSGARLMSRSRSQSACPASPPLLASHPSQSTPSLLSNMASVAIPPHPQRLFPRDTDVLNTLPDPRTPGSLSTTSSRADSVVDSTLNEEIAKISEKLVNAINHQTSLDDSLQQTRHELEIARHHIAQLEAKAREHTELITNGLLIPVQDLEGRESKIRTEMEAEKEQRIIAEKAKKEMEQELETLTSALFTEANTMVSSARREKEASDRKADQFKTQLRDAEILLESQQEQLQDLKAVLEKMASDQDEVDSVAYTTSSAPSTPAVAPGRMSRQFEGAHFTSPSGSEDIIPDHPLHFSDIVKPVLRTDIQTYEDFCSVIKTARAASPPPSRVPSGSYGSLNVFGQGPNSTQTSQTPSSSTTNVLAKTGSTSPRNSVVVQPLPAMRETKLFKRALLEDIEPTLRLDIAPGVSWMIRRALQNRIIDGSLVVEPMPPALIKFRGPVNPCSLCGENRVGDLYERRHRFRMAESSENKNFPLCDLCLGRLRSVGDLLSFLRMVTNGHWRADTDEEKKSSWEEYVKLRERMFWHRICGGVVPVSCQTREGGDSIKSASVGRSSEDLATGLHTENEDPFHSKQPTEGGVPSHEDETSNHAEAHSGELHEPNGVDMQADNGPTNSSTSSSLASPTNEIQKLSLAIPGAF